MELIFNIKTIKKITKKETYIMTFVKYFLAFAFVTSYCCDINAKESKNLQIFNSKNIAWHKLIKVKSRKAGYRATKGEKPAEMWFKPTPGARDAYTVSLKPFFIKGDYDYLLLKYRVMPGTYLTMDTWWDKGKIKRPLRYIKGDGKWKILKLPIGGKAIRIDFCISNKATDKSDTIKKVYFEFFKAVKEGTELKVKVYKLQAPIIIPEPKKAKATGAKLLLAKNNKAEFAVRLNKDELALKQIIAKEIAVDFKIAERSVLNNLAKRKIVINLEFGKECKIPVPDKKEAYAIKFSKSNNQNIITLAAKDKAGLYWAWQTLRQLTEKNNDSIEVNVCDIIDWPDFQYRSMNYYTLAQLKKNMKVKMNVSAYPWWIVKGKMWELFDSERGAKYINTLKSACNYAVARGTNINQWLSPFFEKRSITISDDKQIDKLFKMYEISLKAGSRVCCLSIDDGGRLKNSFIPVDQKAYNNDRLLSHAYFIKKMSDKIYGKYPDTRIFAITKDYESAKGITGYYDRIGVSKDVIIFWTGVQCVTFDYPEYIIKQYEKGIEERRYAIYDNTITQVHGMYRGLVMCEKYAEGYKNLFKSGRCLGSNGGMFYNEVIAIKCLCIAEWNWNASRYNAEKARQRAIAKTAGNIEAVKPILLFSQEYLKIAYKYPIDKRIRPEKDFIIDKGIRPVVGHKKLKKREIAKYSIDDKEYQRLCEKISFLGDTLKEIEQKSRNKILTAEFKIFYRNMKEIIEHLHKNSIPAPTIDCKGSYTFNMNNIPGGVHYKERGPNKLMSAAIYGNQTANNTFTAIFNLKNLPEKAITLELDGWDCDKNLPPMLIKVNNKKVFSGKTTFGHTYPYKTGPGKMNISIPAKYFNKGKIIIKIIDDAPSSDLVDNWIVVAGIKLKF